MLDAYRQLQRDPVLDHAHAELCRELDQAEVPKPGRKRPVQYDGDESHRDSEERKCIEHENRQISVLFLFHKDGPYIVQRQH